MPTLRPLEIAAMAVASAALVPIAALHAWPLDLVYIPLHVTRHLPLTAALYGVFLVPCLVGFRQWRHSLPGTAAR